MNDLFRCRNVQRPLKSFSGNPLFLHCPSPTTHKVATSKMGLISTVHLQRGSKVSVSVYCFAITIYKKKKF